MAASADPKQTSPKVKASAYMGLLVSLLGFVVAGVVTWTGTVTADQLPGLGVWAVPLISLVTTGGNVLAAWWKTDPLRQNYAAQFAAVEDLHQAQTEQKYSKNVG